MLLQNITLVFALDAAATAGTAAAAAVAAVAAADRRPDDYVDIILFYE